MLIVMQDIDAVPAEAEISVGVEGAGVRVEVLSGGLSGAQTEHEAGAPAPKGIGVREHVQAILTEEELTMKHPTVRQSANPVMILAVRATQIDDFPADMHDTGQHRFYLRQMFG